MVNAKHVAFKVNQQTPNYPTAPEAYGTVLNCRKPGGKKILGEQREVRSHHVPLINVPGSRKRKWGGQEKGNDTDRSTSLITWTEPNATTTATTSQEQELSSQKWQLKPTKLRKPLTKGVDLDCWFTILSFSDPAQLLEMRSKVVSCYRFLRNNPMLWKHSRSYYYGDDMPDPPSELTEFQYAHLRHGHGCMSCSTPNTRKTYWAFLRRWCKNCLQEKVVKEQDAIVLLKDANRENFSFLLKCLPSGVFDSWCNFVGAGPAKTHSVKTVYLLSDVKKLVADLVLEKEQNPFLGHDEMRAWMEKKVELIEERRSFARKMEQWEDATRSTKSFDYQARKSARKAYFESKASKLNPPISLREMEFCPSYRRAITIPKEPSNASWLQLKPKLEKEAADLAAQGGPSGLQSSTSSTPETMTPDRIGQAHQPFVYPVHSFMSANLPLNSYPPSSLAPDDNLRVYQASMYALIRPPGFLSPHGNLF
ncbi:hypothetical protein P153DRAFT_295355 [Dothidotthia symphoricarpi CBS 119687]|uniref:F-box domain-containing protein n=1 Tax=Dothidotthia symphoricarpi CBS 119687 TaxID=1392245 RepID=A0A6A6A7B0_9PLEO|nr:uncharacterized protein P153DRAFT_295355 [Dothidotthia symphoricarpi CBS 119687]KAF2127115.1 hypothetical protein P153DRAFT_295355 [Dothidotthia symphoricarpi CBS 119687]